MLFQPLVGLPSVSKNDREEERSDEEDEEEDDAVSDDEDYEDSTPAPRTAFRRSTPTRPYSASSHASHTPSRVASRNSLNVCTNSSPLHTKHVHEISDLCRWIATSQILFMKNPENYNCSLLLFLQFRLKRFLFKR